MTAADREAAARRQRAQEIALWRWTLVEPAMDPALTARQRGQVVRDLASREHEGPDGKKRVPVSRRTLDRWVVARRDGGFEALVPEPAAVRAARRRRGRRPRGRAEDGEPGSAPRRRSAGSWPPGWARAQVPSERAIQRWLAARELNTRPDGQPPEAFGRFEAGAVNEIWTADLMNGPVIGGRDCHLSVIIDDRSRFLTAARFVRRPDAVRFAGVLRAAIAALRHPVHLVLRQRLVLCRQVAAADLRRARREADPQPAGAPDGPREGREGDRDDPAAVHGRGRRRRASPGPAPGLVPGRAQPAAGRVGPDRLPRPGPLRDRGDPAGPLGRGRPAVHPGPGAAAARVRLERGPAGPQDGHRLRWRATTTPSTRSSSAGRSSWSSTRST